MLSSRKTVIISDMPKEFPELADVIKREMQSRSLSTRDLEKQTDVSRDTISRLARGSGPFSASTLDKIGGALGIDPDYLKQLAGLIKERNTVIKNADVLDFALTLDEFPDATRKILLESMRHIMEAYQNAALVAEAKAHRPDLAERAEQIKREKQTKADKIGSA